MKSAADDNGTTIVLPRPEATGIGKQMTFLDTFVDQREAGGVVGSRGPGDILRRGIDLESVISSDNDALRISPLTYPGWGRSGVAYGPYHRESGLAFGVLLLNGHHSSQASHIMQSLPRRLYRWARGGTGDSLVMRGLQWARHADKAATLQQFRRWVVLNRRYAGQTVPAIDENLAVGWFTAEVVADPLSEGQCFSIHAAGPENGELWARIGLGMLPLLRGLQNVPVYLVVILREMGAVYYAASLPNSRVAAAYPDFRPLAIDTLNKEPIVYAGLFQSVLGQIGFRVDTRVKAVQVAEVEQQRRSWYGTAHAADSLNGAILSDTAEVGGRWQVREPKSLNGENTFQSEIEPSLLLLNPGAPNGLIHLIIRANQSLNMTGILFRYHNDDNYWCLRVSHGYYGLWLKQDGAWHEIATATGTVGDSLEDIALQITDDGCEIWVAEDSRPVFGSVIDERLSECTGVGLCAVDAWGWASDFEAHPRLVRFPQLFGEQFVSHRSSVHLVAADDFSGRVGDMAGHTTSIGDRQWQLSLGKGKIALDGRQARVCAAVDAPNPGRTAYTIKWDVNTFADLEVEIMPPGNGRGEGHKGRGGLIFWQDAANYLIVSTWLDDWYGGASLSSFYHLRGFEELYDAVWTNVGSRICWGVPYRLRVTFDRSEFTAYVNDEPVLLRSLRDIYPGFDQLAVHRVGIVVNWEWGDDTGSIFRRFSAWR